MLNRRFQQSTLTDTGNAASQRSITSAKPIVLLSVTPWFPDQNAINQLYFNRPTLTDQSVQIRSIDSANVGLQPNIDDSAI